MRVLVVGGGGREHALAWKLGLSPLVEALYCAPGNAGIAQLATCLPVAADDLDGLVAVARDQKIDFVMVGPEQPLVLGLVDRLEAAGIAAFGPTAAAARLEGSKGFTKDFCARHGIPTAAYQRFDRLAPALAYIRDIGAPIVVKADGLAAGKGVTVATDLASAEAAATALLADGGSVVIEQFLEGEEVSFFALCDGATAIPFGSAQDHKRAYDGDQGPNTGGMGAYSPAPVFTPALEAEVMARIIAPTLAGMAAEGAPFKGILFAGLMLTAEGPMLIEYNTRFGDPETQVLMPRLMSDLLPALQAARDGMLNHFSVRWRERAALTVVRAAEGYPGKPTTGGTIGGLDKIPETDDRIVFHAATAIRDGALVATGGRVLAVTGLGADLSAARAAAYEAMERVTLPGSFCRSDIGWRALV